MQHLFNENVSKMSDLQEMYIRSGKQIDTPRL